MGEHAPRWLMLFDVERQRPEIAFDRLYADQYKHGTVGHNERMIIARMAELLDELEKVPEAAQRIEELLMRW